MCIIVKGMKGTYIFVVLAALMLVTGCDFFRKVAGRPTSADIEDKKVEIARFEKEKAELAREQARLDSLEALREKERLAREQAECDSLAAVRILKDKGCMMYDLSGLKGLASGVLEHGYYVVVGSFRDGANADKFIARIAKDPAMEPVKINFRTGMVAVGVCPRDKITEMASVIDEVRAKSFCPKDAWILVNGK
jgi:hypothetical protein